MKLLSQQDLDVRMQLTGCKYGELVNTYVTNLKWGRKNACDNIKDLLLLNAYIELMECYNVATTVANVNTTAVMTKAYDASDTYLIEFFIGGISVGGELPYETSVNVLDLVNILNSLQTDYIVTADVVSSISVFTLTFTGTCSTNLPIYYIRRSNKADEKTDLTLIPGTCASVIEHSNCITETQLQSMLDNISKLTGMCFRSIGFTYIVPEGYTPIKSFSSGITISPLGGHGITVV